MMNRALSTENQQLGRKNIFYINVREYAMIIALAVIWIILSILDPTFFTPRNLSNLARAVTVTSSLALGVFLVIVGGHLDLSVGSVCGLIGGISAILNVWWGWGVAESICFALVVSVLIGFLQGYLVAYQSVPAFMVTLGGLLLFKGVLLAFTNGITVAPLSPSFAAIASRYVPIHLGWIIGGIAILVLWLVGFVRRASRRSYGFTVEPLPVSFAKTIFFSAVIAAFVWFMNGYKGIPVPVFIILLIAIILIFVVSKLQFGRYVFALGGNVEAAKLSGIDVRLNTMMLFVISAFLAGVGGILYTSRLNAGTASAGDMYELDAIAACVIGGTSISGGRGTVIGVIIGALVMASLENGMSLLNSEAYLQYIVKGAILILAVWFDIKTKHGSSVA